MRESLLQTVTMEELRAMREEGMTNKQIAEALEVGPATIRRHLGPDGTRNGANSPLPPVEELLQMREAGMTLREIAEKFGASESAVQYRLPGRGGKRARHAYDNPPTLKRKTAPTEEYEAALCVQNRTLDLHGTLGVYTVDCKKGEIIASIARADGAEDIFCMTLETIGEYIEKAERFAKELKAIQRKANELRVMNEMW